MKCQKCGKNEVSFQYSSNINGNISQSCLCSECAEQMGYNFNTFLSPRNLMSGFMSPVSTMHRGFMPMMAFPLTFSPPNDLGPLFQNYTAEQRTPDIPSMPVEIDTDMQKRREINLMREQMLKAAENEDYEAAARLRDKIREFEA